VNDAFKNVSTIKMGDSASAIGAAAFDTIRATLQPRDPVYIVTRAPPTAGRAEGKWLLIYYVPDDSIVREKMLYASSSVALKEGLGAPAFVTDYPIDSPKECTLAAYETSLKIYRAEDILTSDELIKKDANAAETLSRTDVKTAAMGDLPISIDAGVAPAIAQLNSNSADTVILLLNQKSEALTAEKTSTSKLEEFAKQMPTNQPRYVLHRFSHEMDGKSTFTTVFIYYCPEAAHPRAKMTYSTFKGMCVRAVQQLGVDVQKQYECTEPSELSAPAVISFLYPRAVEKKVAPKPKPAGKGARRMVGGAKFKGNN